MKYAMALLGAAALSGCSDDCGNSLGQSVVSPDGTLSAVVFNRDCGATTGFTSQISIENAGETPSGKGNVFIADGGTKTASWGGPWVEVAWESPKHLLVRYDASARVFARYGSVDGVEITFQPMRP